MIRQSLSMPAFPPSWLVFGSVEVCSPSQEGEEKVALIVGKGGTDSYKRWHLFLTLSLQRSLIPRYPGAPRRTARASASHRSSPRLLRHIPGLPWCLVSGWT